MAPRRVTPGSALIKTVTDHYVLLPHEMEMLRQAAAVADHIAALDAVVAAEGVTAQSPQGVRAHPALVEARAQRITLARLFVALQLPTDIGEMQRTQRRGGVRKPYALPGGAS